MQRRDQGRALVRYFASLRAGKVVLWCYLAWYLVTVGFRFDPSPTLWLNSLGIGAVIGIGLRLSVTAATGAGSDRWQTFRLFAMPFCVSSFSLLIKGHGYILVFPPQPFELVVSIGACAGLVLLIAALKWSTASGAAP